MFYLLLPFALLDHTFWFQTDLRYMWSLIYTPTFLNIKWGFSQVLIINKILKAIWEAMSENQGRTMAVTVGWEQWVKPAPPPRLPTCPGRPDLHVLVSMAKVYLKMFTKYLKVNKVNGKSKLCAGLNIRIRLPPL